jgi:cAMP phosphodiesterase
MGLPSFLINDVVALDAGWIAAALPLRAQSRIRDILVSHSHLDHTCSLPFLIDNNFVVPGFTVRIHALPEVVTSMRKHLFNNHTWPDFTGLPNDLTPVLKLHEIQADRPFRVSGLTVRAVRVAHLVPTAGFVIEDGESALAYSADTGPTDRFWDVANRQRKLKAVIAELSYPNEMTDLAAVAGHLTPRLLGRELARLKHDVPVYLYGLKPRHVASIERQVKKLGDRRVHVLRPDQRLLV